MNDIIYSNWGLGIWEPTYFKGAFYILISPLFKDPHKAMVVGKRPLSSSMAKNLPMLRVGGLVWFRSGVHTGPPLSWLAWLHALIRGQYEFVG